MTTTHRRIALLTGASLSALGVSVLAATPALAAPHDDPASLGIHPGVATTSDIITICEIADNTACFFGSNQQSASPVLAVVNSVPTGQIRQAHLGNTTLQLVNSDNGYGSSAEVGAVAIVTNTPAFASLSAPPIRWHFS